ARFRGADGRLASRTAAPTRRRDDSSSSQAVPGVPPHRGHGSPRLGQLRPVLSDLEARRAVARPAGRAVRSATAASAAPIGSSLGMLGTTWALAWPAIISFSLESIVSLCDLLLLGH